MTRYPLARRFSSNETSGVIVNFQSQSFTRIVSIAVILLVTIALYGQIVSHDFVIFDDPEYSYANEHVTAGLTSQGLSWAFTSFDFNWHPLTWISLMIDTELFGGSAAGYHLTSLIVHCAVLLVLFELFFLLSNSQKVAFFATLLFSVHPMIVNPVCWISARKDLLSAFFGLLAVLFYLKNHHTCSLKYKGASFGAFLLSMMSKGTFISLPALLLLLDFTLLKRSVRERAVWIEKLPYFILALVLLFVTYLGQLSAAAITSSEEVSLLARCMHAVEYYLEYLLRFFLPLQSAVLYPFDPSLDYTTAAKSLAVLLGFTALACAYQKVRPAFPFGWFWFGIALFPMIGLIKIGGHSIAERYTYVPYMGLAYALVVSALEGKWFLRVLLGVLLPFFFVLSYLKVPIWSDSESLFKETLRHTGENPIIELSLARYYELQGEYRAAEQIYREKVVLGPEYFFVHKNLGHLYLAEARYKEAEYHYQQLLRANPGDTGALNNLGLLALRQKQIALAKSYFERALELRPDFQAAKKNLERLGVTTLPE